MNIDAIILAAGKGTRMKSEKLKVLHKVAGKHMLEYTLDAVSKLDTDNIYLIIGHQKEDVMKIVNNKKVIFVEQDEQKGTGHAVLQTSSYLENKKSHTIVLNADCPLITPETLNSLINYHLETNAGTTILTTELENPKGYGHIIRGPMGSIQKIVEDSDASPKIKEIKEVNTAFYCFNNLDLFPSLKKITPTNDQKEYYLTDVIQIQKDNGKNVQGLLCEDSNKVMGINNRIDLAKANKIIYMRHNHFLMQEGVTILDPETTYIDSKVDIGTDTIIYPFTIIHGKSKIGKNCTIGPHVVLENVTIKDNEVIPPFVNSKKQISS